MFESRLTFWKVWCVLLTACAIGGAADVIQLPAVPAPMPPPTPPPAPGAAIKLTGTQVYDFTTTAPCVVRSYPTNLLTITSAAIPANETFRDSQNFFDGATQRTYKGPCTLYNVKAAGVGRVVMVITPEKTDQASKDIREVLFDVDNGTKPIPPPDPVPPIPPGPTPPPVVTSFRVCFIWESGTNLTKEQNSVINGVEVANYLNAKTTKTDNGVGWRIKDKNARTNNDTPTWNALWGSIKSKLVPETVYPCVAVEVNTKVDIIPISWPDGPKKGVTYTPAEMISVFKTYTGEK